MDGHRFRLSGSFVEGTNEFLAFRVCQEKEEALLRILTRESIKIRIQETDE